MNDPFQLVTNCTFKRKDYLVQMCVFSSKKLELTVTDKLMAEDWHCDYDASCESILFIPVSFIMVFNDRIIFYRYRSIDS